MPWLPIYAAVEDLRLLFDLLSQDEEIGFIISAGVGKWQAVATAPMPVGQSRTALWHVPSGALPLVRAGWNADPGRIENPWGGWKEAIAGADPTVPYFGAGHPGIVWLNSRPTGWEAEIGLSSLEWSGNRYRTIGSPAHPDTERWWRRFGRSIRKHAVRIPRSGPPDGPEPEIWALPQAIDLIRSGASRDDNPWYPAGEPAAPDA